MSTTPPAEISTPFSQQVSIVRAQITELSLLVLRQANIDRRFVATPIRVPTSNAINGACNDAHSRKAEADRVPGDEVRGVRCDERECRDDAANVAETNLDHVSTFQQCDGSCCDHEPAMQCPPLVDDGLRDSCYTSKLSPA